MKNMSCIIPITYLLFITLFSANAQFVKKTYLVQMDKAAMPKAFSNHLDWYSSTVKSALLTTSLESSDMKNEEERIIYSYQNAFHGVAAKLSKEEAERLEDQEGVVAIFPERKYQLHTTRSPEFLGLEPLSKGTDSIFSENLDNDVIVGVLDTGIWPESESFNDTGMKPVPSYWKGACEIGRGFTKQHCNKKIIGARVFYHGYEAAIGKINESREHKSPRDQDGHGTHTAATVAGSVVHGANLLGYAYGTARGMAPGARIAAYKVCWIGGCFSSDILSAIDKAVSDGVHVLSISLGGGVSSYSHDSISTAAFGAMERGVFISCSAGNAGPSPASLANVSPWITTVGASTMDRDFPAQVKLGNGKNLSGASLYKGPNTVSTEKQYPLVYLGGNSSGTLNPKAMCLEGTLDPQVVKGKIVICERGISPRVQKGHVVKNAGGVGMILTNTETNGEELVADCHLLPAVAIGEKDGKDLKNYVLTNKNATATLSFLGTRLGIRPSPVVAAFSSRGPNFLSLEVLKPDLVAPGVNILAAWSEDVGPSGLAIDQRRVKFSIVSGTSMSCPHVSGVAALIKAKHPQWSPAAIKSALMTTAYVVDNTMKPLKDASNAEKPSNPYDHGAGHINPTKALDPGLVYDIKPQDYFDFLCTQNLTPNQLGVFGKYANRSCAHSLASPGDLNYPAISVVFAENKSISVMTVHRTVTNVGPDVSTYHVLVSVFKGASVKVEPETLNFTRKYQKLSYKVTFTTKARQTQPEFGDLVWKDGVQSVRSPIVITWLTPIV
ncbi:hypothetical protein HN51_008092 [Arachis hypogaea]|uniref:Subtilisin-like protease SBT1.3 n=2 Tax=Arachis hypogaea TaxID=3818 RepID=A0A445D4X6_ARAHY|nr:subtilisin-like protease SBT1.3 [Arachis hypogaea]QHO42385.1 uncharacterized protein DS421_5g153730 [Arachis hypogaea]RYR58249.1 hypothetical protein Ahy_A05g023908 isoform C [Arachis hypogaea]